MTHIATATDKPTFEFTLYSTAAGKDYYQITKNGIDSLDFVEVPEGSTLDVVTEAFAAGRVV